MKICTYTHLFVHYTQRRSYSVELKNLLKFTATERSCDWWKCVCTERSFIMYRRMRACVYECICVRVSVCAWKFFCYTEQQTNERTSDGWMDGRWCTNLRAAMIWYNKNQQLALWCCFSIWSFHFVYGCFDYYFYYYGNEGVIYYMRKKKKKMMMCVLVANGIQVTFECNFWCWCMRGKMWDMEALKFVNPFLKDFLINLEKFFRTQNSANFEAPNSNKTFNFLDRKTLGFPV